MRNVIAAVMASTLALSAYSQAAEVVTSVNWLPGDDGGQRGSQSHMFDGISLNRAATSAVTGSYATGTPRQAPR